MPAVLFRLDVLSPPLFGNGKERTGRIKRGGLPFVWNLTIDIERHRVGGVVPPTCSDGIASENDIGDDGDLAEGPIGPDAQIANDGDAVAVMVAVLPELPRYHGIRFCMPTAPPTSRLVSMIWVPAATLSGVLAPCSDTLLPVMVYCGAAEVKLIPATLGMAVTLTVIVLYMETVPNIAFIAHA